MDTDRAPTIDDVNQVRIAGLRRVNRALVVIAIVQTVFMLAIVSLFLYVAHEKQDRIDDNRRTIVQLCAESQKSWDGRTALAMTIWAPPGNTPISGAVLGILKRVGFSDSDVQTLQQNGTALNNQRLEEFNKINGPRPTCANGKG